MTTTSAAATVVRMFRAEYQLTQAHLAALLSDPERPDDPVTRRVVASWENGESKPHGCLWRALRDLRQELAANA